MRWEPLHSGWSPDSGSLQSSPPASCSWRVSSSTQRSWASGCWKRQADEAFQYLSHTRVLPQSSCNGHWRGFPELMKPAPCSVQCKKHLTLSSDARYFTAVGIKFHSSSFSSFIRAPHNPPQAWLHDICRCQYCPSFPDQSLWAPLNSAKQLRTQRGAVRTTRKSCCTMNSGRAILSLLPASASVLIHDICPPLCHYLV